ncbi:unnamed protein product, partial [Prunus brigantina]
REHQFASKIWIIKVCELSFQSHWLGNEANNTLSKPNVVFVHSLGDDSWFQYIPFFLIFPETPFIIPPHTFCTPSSPTTHMDIPDLAWFNRTVSVEKYQWHPEWYRFHQEKLVEF